MTPRAVFMSSMDPEQRTGIGHIAGCISAIVVAITAIVGSCSAFAAVDVDIHVQSPLTPTTQIGNYYLSISDCTTVLKVTAGGSALTSTGDVGDSTTQKACSFPFTVDSGTVNSPSAEIIFLDGTTKTYAETIGYETNIPSVAVADVAVAQQNGEQFASVTFNASDDVDIAYLEVELTGIRASDLRNRPATDAE